MYKIPNKNLFLICFIAVAIVIFGGYFFGFTIKGKTFFNQYFPSNKVTFQLLDHVYKSDYVVEKKIKIDSKPFFESIEGKDGNMSWCLFFQPRIPGSTVFSEKKFPQTCIEGKRMNGELYVADQYDLAFIPIQDSYAVRTGNVTPFLELTPVAILSWIEKESQGVNVKKVEQSRRTIILETEAPIPLELIGGIVKNNSLTETRTEVRVDLATYHIYEVVLTWREEGKSRDLTITFDDQDLSSQDNFSRMKPVAEGVSFGDFAARESVIIRTQEEGKYDYLWKRWEENFYACSECVNPFGDSDGDGFNNSFEFIFDRDPLNREVNHTTTLNMAKPFFLSSVQKFSDSFEGMSGYVGSVRIRSAALYNKNDITFPAQAKKLRFSYIFSGNPNDKDYILVFFDNTMLYRVFKSANNEKVTRDINIEDLAGRQGKLYFVLNSMGVRDDSGTMLVNNIAIVSEKGRVDLFGKESGL